MHKKEYSKSLISSATLVILTFLVLGLGLLRPAAASSPTPAAGEAAGYAGSWSCRECHEKFYQLWAP
jgi:hypothetical protein